MSVSDLKNKLQDTTDGLGKKIDKQIFDTILYLNVRGFTTTSSCEGHLDRGNAYPWVEFSLTTDSEFDLLNERKDELRNLLADTDNNYRSKKVLDKKKEADILSDQLVNKNNQMINDLLKLLSEFYDTRKSDSDRRLIITSMVTHFRIQSQGGMLQKPRLKKDKEKYLGIYQKEMNDFTEFLKSKSNS